MAEFGITKLLFFYSNELSYWFGVSASLTLIKLYFSTVPLVSNSILL
jgi:hypothetical protein